MRLTVSWGLGAVATLLFVGPASALPIEIGYTLDSAVEFVVAAPVNPLDGLGVAGSLDPIPGDIDPALTVLGPTSSICLLGTCDLVNQDWIAFLIDIDSGSLDNIGVTLLDNPGLTVLGMGYFTQGGPIQDGSGGTDTYSGSFPTSTIANFSFLANGGGAGLTGTSLPLFVAYAQGTLPTSPAAPFNNPPFGAGAAQFMIAQWGAGSGASKVGHFNAEIDIIPEPSTGLLLGAGFLVLCARARRRRA